MKIFYSFIVLAVSMTILSFTVTHDGYHVGDTASDFSLMNVDDKLVSLADYPDAKGFIITFTCNHCPYAVMYEDR